MRLVWGLSAAALCAVAMITTGCAGRDVVSLDTVANAATKTEDVGTARVAFEGVVTFNHDHAQRFEFKGHGVADWRTGSAKMTAVYTFPGPIQEAIKEQFGRPASADMIVDGRKGIVLYMRFPFLDKLMPHGKTWLKADIVEMGKAYGLDLDRMKETKQSDPGQMLAYLKSAIGVRRVGSDLIQREVTTHYATIVKAETIIRQAPRDQQEAMRKYLRRLGIKTYPVDIWVDREGVVRKLATVLEYNQPSGDFVRMELSEQYSDFGVKARIRPPAAKSVLDVTPHLEAKNQASQAV
ncbi:MAG TPA: hypothetical protein VFW80_11920 [Gaiellaceae bacterium]|nr:hypothetical protein [Gaiellaceae bacterium]